ncbi:hypothetical protein [Arcobacter sp. CECT 8985]|uniref:hypothetical protein n=1 Tax=Arcobacter sp. CECT 8985 TaxID=1935424 RepID=UPI0013E986B9|nr:hypothetical protein [Arcobacter sp. CECT 8985]
MIDFEYIYLRFAIALYKIKMNEYLFVYLISKGRLELLWCRRVFIFIYKVGTRSVILVG